jgi:hypothetical protein
MTVYRLRFRGTYWTALSDACHAPCPTGYDALAMARVHVDTWRTTYAGIVPDEHLANLSYERCQANWIEHLSRPQGETHAFVAEAQSGHIVVIASCGPLRDTLAGLDEELLLKKRLTLQALQFPPAPVDLARRPFYTVARVRPPRVGGNSHDCPEQIDTSSGSRMACVRGQL